MTGGLWRGELTGCGSGRADMDGIVGAKSHHGVPQVAVGALDVTEHADKARLGERDTRRRNQNQRNK